MPESDYMTPQQVAVTYLLTPQTVWRDIAKGWLPAEKLSERRYIVNRHIAAEYAKRREQYVKAMAHMKDPYTEGESND